MKRGGLAHSPTDPSGAEGAAPPRDGQAGGGANGGTKGGAVWIWLPRGQDGRLEPAAAELLYEGGALARRLGASLIGVCDLPPVPEDAALLRRWGVAGLRLLCVAAPPHPDCSGGESPLLGLLADARAAGERLRAALFPANAFGKVAAPLFAAEADAAYVSNAGGITADGRRFAMTRPALGGQYEALVNIALERPLVVTLRPGTVGENLSPPGPMGSPLETTAGSAAPGPETPLPVLASGAGAHAPPAAPEEAPRLLPPNPATLDIGDAERIVAFGRGAFSSEAVALVERLAQALGASIAGTRPAADEGWLPFSRQVGLTGAIVRPRLYVAVGISGAPYHMVGVREPETLIAVNADPEAHIFSHATLGIVGDLFSVLPALLARLERGEDLAGGEKP